MSAQHDVQSSVNDLIRRGFGVEVRQSVEMQTFELRVWKGGQQLKMLLPHPDQHRIAEAIQNMANSVEDKIKIEAGEQPVNTRTTQNRISELERELEKYKYAVKQLSFDLEMANTNPNLAASVKSIRQAALDQAAEFVMDYGIPKDGRALEDLCQQISKLRETRAMALKRAADEVNRRSEVPF